VGEFGCIGTDESRPYRLVLANDEDSMKIENDSKIPCITFRVGVILDRGAENGAESDPPALQGGRLESRMM
jgi:hypothetical protein